jgi:hypothetical protein
MKSGSRRWRYLATLAVASLGASVGACNASLTPDDECDRWEFDKPAPRVTCDGQVLVTRTQLCRDPDQVTREDCSESGRICVTPFDTQQSQCAVPCQSSAACETDDEVCVAGSSFADRCRPYDSTCRGYAAKPEPTTPRWCQPPQVVGFSPCIRDLVRSCQKGSSCLAVHDAKDADSVARWACTITCNTTADCGALTDYLYCSHRTVDPNGSPTCQVLHEDGEPCEPDEAGSCRGSCGRDPSDEEAGYICR